MKVRTGIGITAVAVGAGMALVGWWIYEGSFAPKHHHAVRGAPSARLGGAAKAHPIHYAGEMETPTVTAEVLDHHGEMVEMACSTCHTTRTPDLRNRGSEGLDEFHQGLEVQHGGMSCLSCHNSDNYDTLRLADGTAIGYEDAMQLCAQCHGPQTRDYRNGSHGGMSGYWDLGRGPRVRNACTVCHDAHSPAYPQMMPVFPPRDLNTGTSVDSQSHH